MFLAYSHSLKNFKTIPVPCKKTRHPFKDAQELNPAIKGGVFPSPSQKTTFFVPNSCASAHSPLNQPAARCAKGVHLVRTRPQLDLPKVSSSARFSVDFRFQTCRVCFLKSRRARKKAQLLFCFLGGPPDILHGHSFPQVKKESVLCSDQKKSSRT